MTPTLHTEFAAHWSTRILTAPPLIAPARQFVYPRFVPGEEETLARGAMLLDVKPDGAPNFLATCALGFNDPSMPLGVYTCPNPEHLLAVSGGYAYLVDVRTPETCEHLALKPVTAVRPLVEEELILLAGFHTIMALDANGVRWTSGRLTWEGLTMGDVRDGKLHGMGWDMMMDRDAPYVLDLATGEHTGGGFGP